MNNAIDTRDPQQVELEVASIYLRLYPEASPAFVAQAFAALRQCFSGDYPGYLPIDTRYHDFEHTLQGTFCLMRLLEGRARAGAIPPVPKQLFELALFAILLHDTGYLKEESDTGGTGAKYTATHVSRSIDFAGEFLAPRGYGQTDITAVQNMIRCTGINADVSVIPFQSELERLLGFALATADLLGQMAASDYIDKLPVLYEEFAEAARFDREKAFRFAIYTSPADVLSRTPDFWREYVLPRIHNDFGGLCRYLNDPLPHGPNTYLERIEHNITLLQKRLKSLT
jgi:hypothetical protein